MGLFPSILWAVIGTVVSHYRIIELLASGGMGVVYKAEDLKLGRLVALKFLPQPFVNNRESLERFRREARAASALNHPNICTIYEIDDNAGQPFIAMELIEGQTLNQYVNGKPVPVEHIIELSLQIADALDAAHSAGILHRDIKPSNLFVTTRQHAKVLDFGLAKNLPKQVAVHGDNQATQLASLTQPGTAAGTVTYMSPEQIRGEDLDNRSDIFSFGLVLYEMATGKIAFTGKTMAVIFDQILREEPAPVRDSNPDVDPQLEGIISKAIAKDRANRYQTATELRSDFLLLRRKIESTIIQLPAVIRPPNRWLMFAAGVVTLLVAAWILRGLFAPPDQSGVPSMMFTQLTSQPGTEYFPSFSPDGRSFVYASAASGNWDIYLQRIGGQNPVNLTKDSAADDTEPVFSRDGEFIAFRSERDGGGIYVMGATGESVRRVTDFGFSPSWSPDGNELVVAEENVVNNPAARRNTVSGIWAVSVKTAQRRLITKGDGVQPAWSPHGDRIVYWSSAVDSRAIWTVRPDGTDPVRVTTEVGVAWSPAWSADGRFLYFSSDRGGNMNLWRVAVDEKSGKVQGLPQPITTGGGLVQRQHATVSRDANRIAYVEELSTENLQRLKFDPASAKVVGFPEKVTRGSRVALNPDPSPDGQWVAFQSLDKQEDLFIVRADGTGERQLTNDVARDRVPRWSPDGKQIAFYSNRSGEFEVWLIHPDGSHLEQFTKSGSRRVTRAVWSPDGSKLALFYSTDGSSTIMDIASRAEAPLPPLTNANEHFNVWSWSPDGKWIAGQRRVSASGEVKALTLYSVERHQYEDIAGAGNEPTWLADNRRLLFDDDKKLFIVDRISKKVQNVPVPVSDLIHTLGRLPNDNRYIYFSVTEPQADIWLINIGENQKQTVP